MKTMYKKLILLFMVFLVLPAAVNAQGIAYYSGMVKNTDNQPIENVTVSSLGAASASTNINGEFLLSFSELTSDTGNSSAVVYFTHPDYNTFNKTIAISPGDSLTGDTITMQILPDQFTVSGKVTYENSDPVRIGEIAFFSIDGIPEHSYYTVPDAEGNYQISVPAGSYYVRSRASYREWPSWAYRYIYYDGADNLADADIFEVSGDADLNFIHKLLSVGSISGTVIDAATLQPISGAEVSVASMPLLDSMIIGTDESGNYSINVFEADYHVFVYKTGYKLTFYNQVYNLFEATPVNVSSENLAVTGIDFALSINESGTNSISGDVTDEDSGLPLSDVEVYAIPLDDGNWIQSSMDSEPKSPGKGLRKTDNNGVYTLNNVRNGSYILLFYKKSYISTFNGKASAWENAPVIILSGNTNINVNIALKKMNSFGGEISGTVMNSQSSLSGTLVSAFDADGKVIASDISTLSGIYNVSSLTEGEYTLIASRVGSHTAEYSEKIQINYVSSLTKNGIDLLLTPTDVKNDPVQPKEYKLMQNYSNPFNPSTRIVFELPNAGTVELKVFDVLGNEVATLVNSEMNPGRHEVTFNAKDLSSGLYFYRIKAGNFVKTMKMILMK